MSNLPQEALPLLEAFAPFLTAPTYRRFVLLLVATLLTTPVGAPSPTCSASPGRWRLDIAPITTASSLALPGRVWNSAVPWPASSFLIGFPRVS